MRPEQQDCGRKCKAMSPRLRAEGVELGVHQETEGLTVLAPSCRAVSSYLRNGNRNGSPE